MNHHKPTSQTLSLSSVPNSSSVDSLPYLRAMAELSDDEMIGELRRIINEQEQRLMQFNQLLSAYLDKIRGIEIGYEAERKYSTDLREKLQQSRAANQKLAIELKLLKSDNLILKSRLGYQTPHNHSKSNSEISIDESLREQLQVRDLKIKEWESKMSGIRNIIKQLLGVFEQVITHNEHQERLLMEGVTELMSYIR